jgi:predicted nucleic acid-binding protein
MSDKFFIDTNVFVYSFDPTAKRKQKIAKDLVASALAQNTGIVSYQVIQEFLNVATQKFAQPLTPQDAKQYLAQVLYPLCEVFPTESLYSVALDLSKDTQYSFYDSLILAAAVAGGCKTLYSEDLCHGRTVAGVTIQNPFR